MSKYEHHSEVSESNGYDSSVDYTGQDADWSISDSGRGAEAASRVWPAC